jgi:hypothetical protein
MVEIKTASTLIKYFGRPYFISLPYAQINFALDFVLYSKIKDVLVKTGFHLILILFLTHF